MSTDQQPSVAPPEAGWVLPVGAAGANSLEGQPSGH